MILRNPFIRIFKVRSGDIPAPRGWHTATAISEERMIVFGGASSDDGKGVFFDDTWMFDNCKINL